MFGPERQSEPTPQEVINRALESPRMRPLFDRKGVRPTLLSSGWIEGLENGTEFPLPPFKFVCPPDEPDLTEIDCFHRLNLLNTRVSNAIRRYNIHRELNGQEALMVTRVNQLIDVANGRVGIRQLGKKSKREIQGCLKVFKEMLEAEQKKRGGETILIEVQSLRKKPELSQSQVEIATFIKKWRVENFKSHGALSAAARQFGISRQRVSQIARRYEKLSGESLTPEKFFSLTELARMLDEIPSVLFRLIKEGEISFGNPAIDQELRAKAKNTSGHRQKIIPASLVQEEQLKELKTQLPEKIMQFLTKSVAQRHKEVYPSLSELARKANVPSDTRNISNVYRSLRNAGFHLSRQRGGNGYYYMAHASEVNAIIEYLKTKYTPPIQVEIVYGPPDALFPKTIHFKRKDEEFIPVSPILKRVIGPHFNNKHFAWTLEIAFGHEQPPFPIYRQRMGRGFSWRVNANDQSTFEALLKDKKDRIIQTLTSRSK